jgi:hypothetical protein
MGSNPTLVPKCTLQFMEGRTLLRERRSNLWLLIATIIPIQLIALHTLLSRGHGCELIRDLQHLRSTRKNSVRHLPACRKGIYFRTVWLYRVRSHGREIPGRHLDR